MSSNMNSDDIIICLVNIYELHYSEDHCAKKLPGYPSD